MPARNEDFPWLSYYGHYKFFENVLTNHSEIKEWRTLGTGLYEIILYRGETRKIFICECYIYGVASYQETIENLGPLNIVIINSNWCQYTTDVKVHCRSQCVGLFNIRDFMAAVGKKDYWLYLNKEDEVYYRRAGLI